MSYVGDDIHYVWAGDIIDLYPRATRMLSINQVRKAWEAYSDTLAAGWIDHQGRSEEEVARILEGYKESEDG